MAPRATGLAVCALLWTAGCAPVLRSSPLPPVTPRYFSSPARLEHGVLDLHLAVTPSHLGPLVLYASGDGGWFGAAVDMFKQLAVTGCPVVGFSSRAFLKIDRQNRLIGTRQLAGEYESLITQARAALQLPQITPVVLTGWSRGAAFAVLVASDLSSTERVAGVIAIGLAEGEDLSVDGPDDETDDGQLADSVKRWPFEPYAQLGRLASVPAAVIQASRDNYLPAARARELFGPDTDNHRFYPVEARNHRFSGGKPAFDRSLAAAMSFVAGRPSSVAPASPPLPPCP